MLKVRLLLLTILLVTCSIVKIHDSDNVQIQKGIIVETHKQLVDSVQVADSINNK